MKIRHVLGTAALAAAITLLSHSSYAFDLSGAWTTDVSACRKIFGKNKQNELSIKGGAGMYGDAFIVRKNAIVGPGGSCTIKAHKEIGQIHHIVAICAAGNVALSTFQFSYEIKDNNKIVRLFPGIEELNVDYSRCTF